MQNNSLNFDVPTFARPKAYAFDATKRTMAVYEELNTIAEEIERCRNANS